MHVLKKDPSPSPAHNPAQTHAHKCTYTQCTTDRSAILSQPHWVCSLLAFLPPSGGGCQLVCEGRSGRAAASAPGNDSARVLTGTAAVIGRLVPFGLGRAGRDWRPLLYITCPCLDHVWTAVRLYSFLYAFFCVFWFTRELFCKKKMKLNIL